jgi:energy-converting hydrogenase Eha subunit E
MAVLEVAVVVYNPVVLQHLGKVILVGIGVVQAQVTPAVAVAVLVLLVLAVMVVQVVLVVMAFNILFRAQQLITQVAVAVTYKM